MAQPPHTGGKRGIILGFGQLELPAGWRYTTQHPSEQVFHPLLSPLRKLTKITAENVNQPHQYKVGHWVLLAHCFIAKVHFLMLFLWLWFIFL
jgi:hypothetical protein